MKNSFQISKPGLEGKLIKFNNYYEGYRLVLQLRQPLAHETRYGWSSVCFGWGNILLWFTPHTRSLHKGGGTLHSLLYFHPQPRSKSWPVKFSCLTPWPHRKSGLDPWLSALTTPIDRLESLWLFISCLWFLPWPLDQLQNFTLTAWPHFDPRRGWEYSRLCSVPLLLHNHVKEDQV